MCVHPSHHTNLHPDYSFLLFRILFASVQLFRYLVTGFKSQGEKIMWHKRTVMKCNLSLCVKPERVG